jgi:hypothetical protein
MDAALEATPGASLAYTQAWLLHDPPGRIDKRTTAEAFQPGPDLPPADPVELFERLLVDNFVFVATACRRTAIEEIGFFNPTIVGVEDYELWLRFAAKGHTFVRVPEPLVIYRRHTASVSADGAAQARARLDLYATVLATYDLPQQTRLLVEQRLYLAEQQLLLASGSAGLRSAKQRLRTASGQVGRRFFGLHLYRQPPNTEVQKTLALASAARKGTAL